jgi:beta-carotene 3-hydroxylase
MVRFTVIALLTFVGMEFVSYVAHRFIYHGPGWFLHKSHHTPRQGRFEWNDVFPLIFASISIFLMMTALADPNGGDLLALSIGITAYGLVYLIVHDLYVHRRMKSLRFTHPLMLKIKKAHMIHHADGGEPYGLLFFVHPRHLKDPAETVRGQRV